MVCVGDVLGPNLITISPWESVGKAAATMNRLKIGGLPVVEEGRLVGIITSRDVRSSHPNRLVADAMTREVVTIPPECSFWRAKELMEQHGIERLVVVRDGRPVGVITKSQLYAEIGKHVDTLTGLHRAEFLQHKAAELLDGGREIAVIFIDLDNFGAIDKEYGHVVGDEILQRVAGVFKAQVDEEVDFLCRYAGDEFAVVTSRRLEEARQLAFRLLRALERCEWPNGIKITASAGVAGGRRVQARGAAAGDGCVRDLINLASLASTKAKREKRAVVTAGWVELGEAV